MLFRSGYTTLLTQGKATLVNTNEQYAQRLEHDGPFIELKRIRKADGINLIYAINVCPYEYAPNLVIDTVQSSLMLYLEETLDIRLRESLSLLELYCIGFCTHL